MEDFEAPIDDGTEQWGDGMESVDTDAAPPYTPIQESPPPTPPQSYTQPQPPPTQPNYGLDDLVVPDEVQGDINKYTQFVLQEGVKMINRLQAEEEQRQLYSRVEAAETRLREQHNGRDGLPEYEDLINRYAIPLMQQRPDIKKLVLSQGERAPEAAYLIGVCSAHPSVIPEVLRRGGKIDKSIFRSSNFKPTVKGQNSERRQPSGKVNYSDWDNESFEAELDRFKMSGE
jgi:hypothetical protein